MLGFIARLKEKRQAQAATDQERYITIIALAAVAGDLSAADTGRLEKLAESLGYDMDRIETDTAALRRAAELEPLIAERESTRAAFKQTSSEMTAHEKETTRIMEDRAATLREIMVVRGRTGNQLAIISDAVKELSAIRQRNPAVFGLPATEVAAPSAPEDINAAIHRTDRENLAAAKPARPHSQITDTAAEDRRLVQIFLKPGPRAAAN